LGACALEIEIAGRFCIDSKVLLCGTGGRHVLGRADTITGTLFLFFFSSCFLVSQLRTVYSIAMARTYPQNHWLADKFFRASSRSAFTKPSVLSIPPPTNEVTLAAHLTCASERSTLHVTSSRPRQDGRAESTCIAARIDYRKVQCTMGAVRSDLCSWFGQEDGEVRVGETRWID
jgi:hypothetical protein